MSPAVGGPAAQTRHSGEEMVLPVRIELTTSALPRMRSTTELRQHFGAIPLSEQPHHHAAAQRGPPPRAGEETERRYGRSPDIVSRRVAARLAPFYARLMTAKDEERVKRLAAALRENLRRRKAQARASAGPEAKDGANGAE